MRKKLIAYVNDLFAQAPKNPQARDLHDEILLNTLDRFDEEVAAGQPEQAAFDAAVAGIGDIDELLEPLGANKSDVIFRRVIAIALYVCCVIPVILTEAFGGVAETVGICLMFVLAALATYLLLSANVTAKTKKRKRLRALGIALYVVCVTPTILFDGLLGGKAGEAVGVSLMFLIAAAATGLVVYSANRTVKKTPARTAAVQKETEEKTTSKLSSILTPIYWILRGGRLLRPRRFLGLAFCLAGLPHGRCGGRYYPRRGSDVPKATRRRKKADCRHFLGCYYRPLSDTYCSHRRMVRDLAAVSHGSSTWRCDQWHF